MNFEKRGDITVGFRTEAERFMEKLGWRHDMPGRFVKGKDATNDVEGTLKRAGFIYHEGNLCKMVPLTDDEKK